MLRSSPGLLRLAVTLAAISASLAATTAPADAQRAQPAAPIRPLPYTRIVLPNGFVAILNEDHASPIVAVDLYYRVGSRDDTPGRAGIAHLCEHMMVEGSPNLPQVRSVFYRSFGGTSPRSALTTEDITHYYVIVPSNRLETVLWAESDAMAAPLSRADSEHVANVRTVVGQERLQGPEATAFAAQREIALRELYPSSHPYHASGLSPMADLPKLTATDVREACLPYYVPNNAVIALSGDFNTVTAKKWIEKYFGGIPRGAAVKRAPTPPVTFAAEKRLVLEDSRSTQPRLVFDWVGASYSNPDRMPLLALAATLSPSLFGFDGHFQAVGVEPSPNLGRLSKLLVVDRKLATRVIATNSDVEHSGVFELLVIPRAGASLTQIELLVDSVIAGLAAAPVTAAEIARFNAFNEVGIPASLQPRYMRADTLAHDEIFAGDPAAYAKQANAARAMTPADVQRVVRKYLTPGRLVMSLVPAGKLDLISKPELPYTNATPPYAVKK